MCTGQACGPELTCKGRQAPCHRGKQSGDASEGTLSGLTLLFGAGGLLLVPTGPSLHTPHSSWSEALRSIQPSALVLWGLPPYPSPPAWGWDEGRDRGREAPCLAGVLGRQPSYSGLWGVERGQPVVVGQSSQDSRFPRANRSLRHSSMLAVGAHSTLLGHGTPAHVRDRGG